MSVIEAMIASGLLATALVVLSQLLTGAVISNVAAGTATTGVVLASQKIEEFRSAPVRPPDGMDHVATFVRRWTLVPVPASPLGTYVVHVRVETAGRVVTSLIAAARW